jgi:3-hydroxyisobutyrate dehydrogenase-like beta-hydroxyacid dehydrogenase
MSGSVGVVGLGAMGGSIAQRLVARGKHVTVFDLNDLAVDRLVRAGATGGTLADIAKAETVVFSLPGDAAVRSVGQSIAGDISARTVIEMSSVLPETVRSLSGLLGSRGNEIIDAPVSGGPSDALGGTLSLMIGAEADLSDRASSVLSELGTINLVGRIGDGKAVKLVNNMMAMGNVAVAAESFQLGVSLGIEPRKLYEVLSNSGGRSNHFNKRFPWVLEEDFVARFAVRLAEKDLRLAIEVAHEAKYPTPVTAAIHQVYESAIAHDLADEDVAALVKLYRN